jgi:Mn-dependent DtxR family transcriptional regulator
MPISREQFFKGNSTIADRILNFMKEHKNSAYRPKEVADALKIKSGSSTAFLGKLADKGLLITKHPYYIFRAKPVKTVAKKKGLF